MPVRIAFRFIMTIVVIAAVSFAKNAPHKDGRRVAPGEVIVKFRPAAPGAEAVSSAAVTATLSARHNLSTPKAVFTADGIRTKQADADLARVYRFTVPSATDVEALAQRLRNDPSVEFAEPHYYFPVHAVPNDPLRSQIYPLDIVRADSAWDVQKGDSSVIIGIIDSGVDWDHPDLASVIWTNTDEIAGNGIDDDGNGKIDDVRGWDFVAGVSDAAAGEDASVEDNNPMDFDGHGTHVSGIAAGATNNGTGIASLGWGCRIMPLRAGWHATDGLGYVSSLYASQAYVYAADNGASVCNQSSGTSDVVLEGARYAFKKGVVITNSAGNSNTDFAASLGQQPWALSVAATNSADQKASYSSFNAKVDIAAPGGDFSSGNRKGFLSSVVNPSSFYGGSLYTEFQGTSMASPFVAALAGLVKSQHPTWNAAQVMFQITGTADNINGLNPSYAGKLGYGRINALRAVKETVPDPAPSLVFQMATVNDAGGGNGNGIAEAGENISIIVTVGNEWGDAKNLTATLTSGHWAASITKGASSYGTLRGISVLDSSTRGNGSDAFTVALSADAVPDVVPFTVTFTAAGGYSKQFSFSVPVSPRILLVDDDDGTVDVEPYYAHAFKSVGASYDVWNHQQRGTPSLSVLQQYAGVVWACEWTFPSLDSADRAVLTAYLNGGGRLFISGQDIGWDLADASGETIPNEYGNSGGTSKTFFEQYLKAKYVADDAVTGNIVGTPGDSIGSGLSFARYQPGRAAGEQYPDVVDPNGGSVTAFRYADGSFAQKGAGVLYSGAYRLVYLSFGGFESIADTSSRVTVMERLLKWVFEYDIATDKLRNTENTASPYPVSSVITSKSPLTSIDLYWDGDGVFPYTKVPMTLSGGKYTANIPAQTAGTTVRYFVLPKSANGYLPYLASSFYVGPDTIKPVMTVPDTIRHTIDVNGPYAVSFTASDDIAMDTASALIHFSVNKSGEQTVPMTYAGNGQYTGAIVPGSDLGPGDAVTYYLTVTDAAQVKNTARFPVSGTRSFSVGREFIDGFEDPSVPKWNKGLWGATAKQKYNGTYSFTDSPDSNYKPNSDRIAVLASGLDLTPYTAALVTYHQRFTIHTTDTASVEVSRNGTDWTRMRSYTGANLFWKRDTLNLNGYTGAGNGSVLVRFRMKSDGANESDGIYIDNVDIVTNQFTSGVRRTDAAVPTEYALLQNYPNPFNPSTTIRFAIPATQAVEVTVFDMVGRAVARPVSEVKEAGEYSVRFDGSGLSSGVYYYRIRSGAFTAVRKMQLIK